MEHQFFSNDPKRYDYFIDNIVPLMVSYPKTFLAKYKELFGEDAYNEYLDYLQADRAYVQLRIKEKYLQHIYCFFPEMYERYEKIQLDKEIQEQKQNKYNK